MFRADLPNGQNVEGNKPRQEAIALLKACKLQPPGAKKTGGPLNPPYLSEMPSVEKVMQAMKTNDPRETALRQMGAFYQLIEIIATLSGAVVEAGRELLAAAPGVSNMRWHDSTVFRSGFSQSTCSPAISADTTAAS